MKPIFILQNNTQSVTDVKLDIKAFIPPAKPGDPTTKRTYFFNEPNGLGVDPGETALYNMDYTAQIENIYDAVKVRESNCSFYRVETFETTFGKVMVYILPNYTGGTVCPAPPTGPPFSVVNALVGVEIQDGKSLTQAIQALVMEKILIF